MTKIMAVLMVLMAVIHLYIAPSSWGSVMVGLVAGLWVADAINELKDNR